MSPFSHLPPAVPLSPLCKNPDDLHHSHRIPDPCTTSLGPAFSWILLWRQLLNPGTLQLSREPQRAEARPLLLGHSLQLPLARLLAAHRLTASSLSPGVQSHWGISRGLPAASALRLLPESSLSPPVPSNQISRGLT